MFATIDKSKFPEVRVTFSDDIDETSFNDFLNEWRNLYVEKKYFSFVFDTTEMGFPPLSYCYLMVQFLQSMKLEKEHYLKSSIIIIPNNYIVYLLDLIFTIENPISDVKVINNEGVILNEYKAAQINDS
tara:strand:- start:1006 stop:1392 length:387 start_codon:yes stop_codon:yes gene_type:complete